MLSHSPSISTSNLTLYLDAANPRSYPGSGTSWFDLSDNGHTATLVAAPTFSSNNGGYFTLNGTTQYAEVADSALIRPTSGVISTTAWFYVNNWRANYYQNIILNKENEYEIAAGLNAVWYAFRPNWAWVGNSSISLGSWVCACVTYDGSNQRLYINGIQTYSAALTGAMGTYTNALRIGARSAPGAASDFLDGRISAVQIHNIALTADQVLQNFNALRGRFGL